VPAGALEWPDRAAGFYSLERPSERQWRPPPPPLRAPGWPGSARLVVVAKFVRQPLPVTGRVPHHLAGLGLGDAPLDAGDAIEISVTLSRLPIPGSADRTTTRRSARCRPAGRSVPVSARPTPWLPLRRVEVCRRPPPSPSATTSSPRDVLDNATSEEDSPDHQIESPV
jgi:hypothetical protein